MSERSNQLAERRTNWAEDRTLLANERTYAGWMRTALACMGVGLGLQAIFGKFDPTWLARLGASLFVLLGLFIIFVAWRQSTKVVKRLSDHDSHPIARKGMTAISAGFAICGTALLGLLWML